MNWFDATETSVGEQTTIGSLKGTDDSTKLAGMFKQGANAANIPGTNDVVVGPDYFTNDTQTQQIGIAAHEALHAYLRLNDPDLATWLHQYGGFQSTGGDSGQMTDWIVGTKDHMSTSGGGCNNAGNPQ